MNLLHCILISIVSIDCKKLTYCNSGETCFVQQITTVSGSVLYNSGCKTISSCTTASAAIVGRAATLIENRSADTTMCEECCSGDFCNNNGCGTSEIPIDKRGPYCFTCDVLNPRTDCNDVNGCAADEVCLLYTPPEYDNLPETIYRGRCETRSTCNTIASNNDKCLTRCCHTDFCNDKCETPNNTTVAITYPSSTTSLSSSTTINTRSTTAKPNIISTLSLSSKLSISASTGKSTPTTNPVTSSQVHCDTSHGFVFLQSAHAHLCVHFGNQHTTWHNARSHCQTLGSDLVVLDTHSKAVLLRKYITSHSHLHDSLYWIGAKDFSDNNHYTWVNGRTLKHSHADWSSHEPDGHDQDCVGMSEHVDMAYTWKDKKCDDKGNYICGRE